MKVDVLVTDRHKQINKWIRETHPQVKHYYDIWHVAKGFRKKLETLAKQKDCELVGKWERSIINHMYWSVASTPNGDGEMMKIKWLSLDNHIHNLYSNHHELFRKCSHGPLNHETGRKKWFTRRK